MKLGNTIILTLPEFRREFKASQLRDFWNVRHQFIREMDWKRSHVCYWDERDIAAFNTLKEWIEDEDDGTVSTDERKKGIDALRQLSGSPIQISDDEFMLSVVGVSREDIIYADKEKLILPEYANTGNQENKERIHKIEVAESLDCPVSIYIGETKVATINPDECIYVTEIQNKFVRILPNIKEVGDYKYELINVPGQYRSILKKTKIGASYIFYKYDEPITHFWFERGDVFTSDSEYLKHE